MNSCKMARQLSALIDGALEGKRLEQLERHIAQCPLCQEELARFRKVEELLREVPPIPVPQGLAERVIARVRAEEGQFESRWAKSMLLMRPRLRYALTGLAMAAGVILGIFLGEGLSKAIFAPPQRVDLLEIGGLSDHPPGSLSEVVWELIEGGRES